MLMSPTITTLGYTCRPSASSHPVSEAMFSLCESLSPLNLALHGAFMSGPEACKSECTKQVTSWWIGKSCPNKSCNYLLAFQICACLFEQCPLRFQSTTNARNNGSLFQSRHSDFHPHRGNWGWWHDWLKQWNWMSHFICDQKHRCTSCQWECHVQSPVTLLVHAISEQTKMDFWGRIANYIIWNFYRRLAISMQ